VPGWEAGCHFGVFLKITVEQRYEGVIINHVIQGKSVPERRDSSQPIEHKANGFADGLIPQGN
jgi:hypothetical protein